MTVSDRVLCERKVGLITGYFEGKSVKALCTEFKMCRPELIRLRDRCITLHPDGRIWGFRACGRYQRQKRYLRTCADKSKGKAGLLGRLFRVHPGILEEITTRYLKLSTGCTESRVPIQKLHAQFIKLCRKAGIPETDYPFNTEFLGSRGFGLYLRREINGSNYAKLIAARNGQAAADRLSTGLPYGTPQESVLIPFQRVIVDEHRLNAYGIIQVPHPMGGEIDVIFERLNIVLFIDYVTRCILGYYVSLNSECTADDIAEGCQAVLEPWKPKKLQIPNLNYAEGAGFPSGVIPSLRGAVWAELLLDNSRAHQSTQIRALFKRKLGCAVNFGPTATPERRARLERLWKTLDDTGCNRLTSTTGNGPTDVRRTDPEGNALKYRIKYEDILDVLEVDCTAYNVTEHSALCFRTPLAQMRYFVEQKEVVIPKLTDYELANLNMVEITKKATVRGDQRIGRRPYVSFMNERYSNTTLANNFDLIGTELTLVIATRDIRNLQAFLPNGTELGQLNALGKWRYQSHDLTTRRLANRMAARKILRGTLQDDPVELLMESLTQQAPNDKKAAKKLMRLRAMKARAKSTPKPRVAVDTKDSDTTVTPSKFAWRPSLSKRAVNL